MSDPQAPAVAAANAPAAAGATVIRTADDADERLAEYLARAGWHRPLVVADANTVEVMGEDVAAALERSGLAVSRHVFARRSGLRPDEASVAALDGAIEARRPDGVVAVGSGTLNDIVRYTSHRRTLPYVTVATAPSMDGYLSTVAAMEFRGLKTTVPAHAPGALFARPSVLAAAPRELVVSGFGDLVGKAVSLTDWRLAQALYGEEVCERAFATTERALVWAVGHAEAVARREAAAVVGLYEGLLASGRSMALVASSRPASGSEHHLSHYWDFLSAVGRRGHHPHGLQVGYATHWMIDVYERLPSLGALLTPTAPDLSAARLATMRARYGDGAALAIAEQRAKRAWLTERQSRWPGGSGEALWRAIRPRAYTFAAVRAALEAVGIVHRVGYLDVSASMLTEAIAHAGELRARYTVLDLLQGQGRLEAVAAAVGGR